MSDSFVMLWTTLCDLLGSFVHGIVQEWILQWVTMPVSPGNLPNPGIEPVSLKSPALQVISLALVPPEKHYIYTHIYMYTHIYTHIYNTHIYIHIYNHYNMHGMYILKGLMLHWNWYDICVCMLHFLYSLSLYCQKMTALVLYFMISSVQV